MYSLRSWVLMPINYTHLLDEDKSVIDEAIITCKNEKDVRVAL